MVQLEQLGLEVDTCVGWMTSRWRRNIGLEKSHTHDAVAMICRNYQPRFTCRDYLILPKRKKLWEDNPTKVVTEKQGFRHWDLIKAAHKHRGSVVGSVRSLKADRIALRTAWDDNFLVSYSKARLLWRFNTIIYI